MNRKTRRTARHAVGPEAQSAQQQVMQRLEKVASLAPALADFADSGRALGLDLQALAHDCTPERLKMMRSQFDRMAVAFCAIERLVMDGQQGKAA